MTYISQSSEFVLKLEVYLMNDCPILGFYVNVTEPWTSKYFTVQ